MKPRIYLDWNATSPLWPEVAESMKRAIDTLAGNASSIHREGQAARAQVERARRALARAIGAPAQAVVLCGGATEANNQVLRTHARFHPAPSIVCTAVEHASVLEVVEDLGRAGVEVALWPVDDRGRLDLAWLEARLRQRAPSLVSVMAANNEIGNLYPIAAIAAMLAPHTSQLHVDATQVLGRRALDVSELGADVVTLSMHKCGGPKGVGAIVMREGVLLEAMMHGGHQERGRRPGTENVPALAGLETFAEMIARHQPAWQAALEAKRELWWDALREAVAGPIALRGEPGLANTFNLAFEPLDGEDVLLALDLEGIAVSSGSACTAGSVEPSAVLLAMGFEARRARQSVRLSFGPSTSDEDLLEAATRIGDVVNRLRALHHD